MGIVRTGRNCNADGPSWGGMPSVGPSLPIGSYSKDFNEGCESCGNKSETLVVYQMLVKKRALCPKCIKYYKKVGFID